jgi:RNA polymerase sigma-70 factor (ECF subfamily)
MSGRSSDDDASPPLAGHRRFDSTRWSLVQAAGQAESSQVQVALEELCRTYWPPIYAEIRRRGHDRTDAQDLTQGFFAQMLRRNTFGRAEREKGRLRSYLLAALDHFLADEWRAQRAGKRGGGVVLLPLDAVEAEGWHLQPPAPGLTPAEMFDQRWAVLIMDRALASLREEYETTGRGSVFAAMQPFLAAEPGKAGYAEHGEALNVTAEAFKVGVHRLRRRFRLCVRDQVAQTVANPAEVEAEMHHLFGM